MKDTRSEYIANKNGFTCEPTIQTATVEKVNVKQKNNGSLKLTTVLKACFFIVSSVIIFELMK